MFMTGDLVNYVGQKLNTELRGKIGEICSKVKNVRDEYVVDFDNGDSYVMHESLLSHHSRKSNEDFSVHSLLRRKRVEADADSK